MFIGVVSLIVVSLVCGFWLIILSSALLKIYKSGKNNSAHSGRIVTATIKSAVNKGGGRFKMMTIIAEFSNLSNSKVEHSFTFKDSKPDLNRYTEGNNIQLKIVENEKNGPSVVIEGSEKKRSTAFSFILFVLWAGAIYGTYFIYQLSEERLGGDWSRLDRLAEYPVVALMGSILIVTLLFIAIVFKAVGILPNKKKGLRDMQLLIYGIRATAHVIRQEETGTRINNQPVIRFHYSFKDDFGGEHSGQDQMVLGAIELAKHVNETEVEILYDRNEKSHSRMMSAMNKGSIQGCIGLVFLFMALIFSSIIIVTYILQPV